MKIRGKVLLATVTAMAIQSLATSAWGQTGSWTFHVDGTEAPANTSIRITAKTEGEEDAAKTYDQTHVVGGMTENQIRNLILLDMGNAGWQVTVDGNNGILIFGGGGKKIKQVDGGGNTAKADVKMDGNVEFGHVEPGDKKFKFACSLPNADGSHPGMIRLDFNDEHTALAALDSNDTPEDASEKLETGLEAAGFVVERVGSEITLDWENPTNLALLGDEVDIDFVLEDGAGGPHLAIGLPDSRSQDVPVFIFAPTVSEWGLIVMTLLLLAAGTVVFARRRRPAAAAD